MLLGSKRTLSRKTRRGRRNCLRQSPTRATIAPSFSRTARSTGRLNTPPPLSPVTRKTGFCSPPNLPLPLPPSPIPGTLLPLPSPRYGLRGNCPRIGPPAYPWP
ncbi:uncharacterized protein LOC113467790 [Diaphorina citri]|uniref:Uncharacterized protein LOC113467790 n=1 Tax=Diaphorina citri TaxID=121845 RepID=A0A3Q0IUT8_DIACI|nr:uncharacterized protein LOC113467790 [Diaphorina citri]